MSEIRISDEAKSCADKILANFISSGASASTAFIAAQAIEELLNQHAAELEALTKEVERLKQLHTTDMRVTNESADFHMKRCDQLRTQNRELREIAQVLLYDSVVVPSEVQRFKDTLARSKEVEG